MKIRVGEYVRTKSGIITKVKEVQDSTIMTETVSIRWIFESNVKKHSSKIIDLIEVGDIIRVEGLDEVKEVIDDSFFDEIVFGNDRRAIIDDRSGSAYSEQLKHFKILKVVTHEQFQRMEYKVNNE